jgi:hypothetical protein
MTWSWLVAFVVFGGMPIGLRFHAGIREDAPLRAQTFRWSGRIFAAAALIWGGMTLLAWNSVHGHRKDLCPGLYGTASGRIGLYSGKVTMLLT